MKSSIGIALSVSYLPVPREPSSNDTRAITFSSGASTTLTTSNRRRDVPTYIMLTTLTPEGVQTIKNNPARIREVNREIEQLGATVKAQWATLGQFDFVNVVEAPDEKVIARVSLELGSRGTGKYETLSAIPIDDFIGSI